MFSVLCVPALYTYSFLHYFQYHVLDKDFVNVEKKIQHVFNFSAKQRSKSHRSSRCCKIKKNGNYSHHGLQESNLCQFQKLRSVCLEKRGR